MSAFKTIYPTIPVTDLARARQFYENVLGLEILEEVLQGVAYKVGEHSQLYIYPRAASKADHTLAGFRVDDIEKTVDDLAARGVSFEHYDYETLKTDARGIATTPPVKAAWFRDPDGNIIGITEHM